MSGKDSEFLRSGLEGVESWGCRSTCVWPHEDCQIFHSAACSDSIEISG